MGGTRERDWFRFRDKLFGFINQLELFYWRGSVLGLQVAEIPCEQPPGSATPNWTQPRPNEPHSPGGGLASWPQHHQLLRRMGYNIMGRASLKH